MEVESTMEHLQEFGRDIWLVEGPIVRDAGTYFTTRMTVVKLTDGSVWIESPVPASFAALREISSLGEVRYLLAATPRHAWRLDAWHTLFPAAECWACRPTAFTLKKGDLPLAGYLGETPLDAWRADFDQLEFRGNPFLSEVLFFHRSSRTVILGDLIQRNPVLEGKTMTNLTFKIAGAQYPDGGVGLDMRLTFLNRGLARQSLEKLLSWDFDKLVIAHGACIASGAKDYVKKVFRWLVK
jgi:hypothetical protein